MHKYIFHPKNTFHENSLSGIPGVSAQHVDILLFSTPLFDFLPARLARFKDSSCIILIPSVGTCVQQAL